MTRDQRLAQISDVDYDFSLVVPDVYRVFSNEETGTFFQTIHKGLSLIAMQAALTTAEELSCLSPEEVLPYQRKIWVPITASAGGTFTFDPAPYSILGVKATVGATPDWVSGAAYSRTTGIVSGLAAGALYWIPEILSTNPWIWTRLARPIGVYPKDVPTGYSPAHIPPYLQAVREGIRGGTRTFTLKHLVSAVAGNPFAYADGKVVGISATSVSLEVEEGIIECEIPEGTGSLPFVNIGTNVRRFDPLVVGSCTVTTSGRAERAWGTPADVVTASGDRIKLTSAFASSFGFSDRIRLRVLSTGFDEVFLVRAVYGDIVVIEGDLPVLGGLESAIAQRLEASPEGADNVAITVVSSYGNGHEAFLNRLLPRALPPGLTHTLAYS